MYRPQTGNHCFGELISDRISELHTPLVIFVNLFMITTKINYTYTNICMENVIFSPRKK